ncbi:MAG: hypothetical protein V1770_02595 [bacterium]
MLNIKKEQILQYHAFEGTAGERIAYEEAIQSDPASREFEEAVLLNLRQEEQISALEDAVDTLRGKNSIKEGGDIALLFGDLRLFLQGILDGDYAAAYEKQLRGYLGAIARNILFDYDQEEYVSILLAINCCENDGLPPVILFPFSHLIMRVEKYPEEKEKLLQVISDSLAEALAFFLKREKEADRAAEAQHEKEDNQY